MRLPAARSRDLPRRQLLQLLSLASAALPSLPASAGVDRDMFDKLRNRYILLRPGETTFEAAGLVDSNPINRMDMERGLTDTGKAQVLAASKELQARGVGANAELVIWYDTGARAAQTAEMLGVELSVPRTRLVPEYDFLQSRGLGGLDGGSLSDVMPLVRALDRRDSGGKVPEGEDGTPSDSIDDVFVRARQALAKMENSYLNCDMVIVADSDVLSTLTAAACGVPFEMHASFALQPGQFRDMREALKPFANGARSRGGAVAAGGERTGYCLDSGSGIDAADPDAEAGAARRSAAEQAAARDELAPATFFASEAGSWALGGGSRR